MAINIVAAVLALLLVIFHLHHLGLYDASHDQSGHSVEKNLSEIPVFDFRQEGLQLQYDFSTSSKLKEETAQLR